jgi:hypothetical protein
MNFLSNYFYGFKFKTVPMAVFEIFFILCLVGFEITTKNERRFSRIFSRINLKCIMAAVSLIRDSPMRLSK